MNILRLLIIFWSLFSAHTVYAYSEPPSAITINKASIEKKYIFIFFYRNQDERTVRLQKVFDQAISKSEGVKSLKINASDPSELSLIKRLKLTHSPMPFVIVLAPNGAITGGFPSFTQRQLMDSMTSPGTAKCLKALQDNKLVLLCLQNKKTTNNKIAIQVVNSFKTDSRFSKSTEVVMIDPADSREHQFLEQLDLNPNTSEATTVLISPPGTVIKKYQGPIKKIQLVSDLKKATSGCCGGKCCSGGCVHQKEPSE